MRPIILTALLLSVVAVMNANAKEFSPMPAPATNLWNIQFELLRVKGGTGFITYPDYLPPAGTRLGTWMEFRLVSATVQFWRLRAGTSYGAGYLGLNLEGRGDVGFGSFFPVRVGYTLFQRPVDYEDGSLFRGMFPDVFAEVELNWLTIEAFSPIWKAGVCAEVDRYGGGAGMDLAVLYSPGQKLVPTASIYVRIATNLGF